MHGMWIEMDFTYALCATIGLTPMVRAPRARQLKYLSYSSSVRLKDEALQ